MLDAACGTGRGTVGLAEAVGPRGSVDALDISEAMLGLAQDKIEKLGLGDRVAFRQFWRKNPAYDAGVRPGRSGARPVFPLFRSSARRFLHLSSASKGGLLP